MTLLQKTEPARNYKTEEKQKGKNKNTHNTNVSLLVILQRLIRNCKNITPLFRFSTCHGSKEGSLWVQLFFSRVRHYGEAVRKSRSFNSIINVLIVYWSFRFPVQIVFGMILAASVKLFGSHCEESSGRRVRAGVEKRCCRDRACH